MDADKSARETVVLKFETKTSCHVLLSQTRTYNFGQGYGIAMKLVPVLPMFLLKLKVKIQECNDHNHF